MRFSILIPVYNTAAYLNECLESVEHQTFRDFEVIIIDDGSTDGSSLICDEFHTRFPSSTVIHKQNEGSLQARLDAIQFSKGEYIIYLDSDDELHQKTLETCNRVIEETASDLIIYGFSRSADFSSRDDDYDLRPGIFPGNQFRLALSGGRYCNLWGKAIKRSLCYPSDEKINHKRLLYAEDWFQLLTVANNVSACCFVDEPLYYYRDNAASITSSYSQSHFVQLTMVLRCVHSYAARWGDECLAAFSSGFISNVYNQIAGAALSASSHFELIREYSELSEVMGPGFLDGIKASGTIEKIKLLTIRLIQHHRCRLASLLFFVNKGCFCRRGGE